MPTKELWEKIYQLWQMNRGGLAQASDQEFLSFLMNRFSVKPDAPSQTSEVRGAELTGYAEIPDYKAPDEKAQKARAYQQSQLGKNVVEAACGESKFTRESDRLWKQVPGSGKLPENFFDPLDELLLSYQQPGAKERADLIGIYTRKAQKPQKPFVLTKKEQKALDELTVKGAKAIMSEKSMNDLRRITKFSEAELPESYYTLSRSCRLADELLEKRPHLFNEAEIDCLKEIRQLGKLLDSRMDLAASPEFTVTDTDAIRRLNPEQSRALAKKLPEKDTALKNYLLTQAETKALVERHVSEEITRAEEWEIVEMPKLTVTGQDRRMFDRVSSLEKLYNHVRDIMFSQKLNPEQKQKEARLTGNFLTEWKAYLTPEQYQQYIGDCVPGFRSITDPTEKANREKLHNDAIRACTVAMLDNMQCFRRGIPAGADRLDQQMFAILNDADQQKLFDYCQRKHDGKPLPDDDALRRTLAVTAARNMIAQKKKLEDCCSADDAKLIEDYPKLHGLIVTGAAADDYIKTAPDEFTEEEKATLRQLNSLGSRCMSRMEALIQPQYVMFDCTDPFVMPLSQLMDTSDKLEARCNDSFGGFPSDELSQVDLTRLRLTYSKAQLSRAPEAEDKLGATAKKILETDSARQIRFCSRDGKNLNIYDAGKVLDEGADVVYCFIPGKKVVPLFCKNRIEGEILTGDAARQADLEAVSNRELPAPPQAPIDAEDDPEPTFGTMSGLWDSICQRLLKRHSAAYEEYSRKHDEWSAREEAREDWEMNHTVLESQHADKLNAIEQTKQGRIPDAVYKAAKLEAPKPEPKSEPLPAAEDAALFREADAASLLKEAEKQGALPEQFRRNIETMCQNAKTSYDALRSGEKTGQTPTDSFVNILVFNTVKTQIRQGKLTPELTGFLARHDSLTDCAQTVKDTNSVSFMFRQPGSNDFYIKTLRDVEGKNVLGELTGQAMNGISLRARTEAAQKQAPTGSQQEPEKEKEKTFSDPKLPDKTLNREK